MIDPALIFIILALLCWLLYLKGSKRKGILANDDMTLRSDRLGLVGRPDRIIKHPKGYWIPIEKKSAHKVQDSHRVQLCVYMILIEEKTGQRPPYGIISLGNGREQKITNSEKLRQMTWQHIHAVREIKHRLNRPAAATPFPAKCRACGYRDSCLLKRV